MVLGMKSPMSGFLSFAIELEEVLFLIPKLGHHPLQFSDLPAIFFFQRF